MRINPINVINLLLTSFQTMVIPDSPYSAHEIELKNHFETILLDAMNSFNGVEMIVEESLDFMEQYKEPSSLIIEDDVQHHFPDAPLPPTDHCTNDEELLSYEYKMDAVQYWRSGKTGNLNLQTVQNIFRLVKSERQLRRWAHYLNRGGTYREKIERICDFTLENFKAAVLSGLIVHDRDLQKWALKAQKMLGDEDFRFRASKTWLLKFKNAHRIVSRKINKFVTKKSLENAEELQKKASEFVENVKPLIREIGAENIFNSDQSGFQLEMHSGRTLAVEGEKQVQCLVQSVTSTTHSYTVQPIISASGKLLSPLFLVLKEPTGKFGPIVRNTLFKPENVYVMASKSGKLTTGTSIKTTLFKEIVKSHFDLSKNISLFPFSEHFKTWLTEVYFPNVEDESVLLIDSWSGHCPRAVLENTPENKTLHLKLIPTGTTGKIQPLDVYGFRVWKNYVKQFSDNVLLFSEDLNLHHRNNIIKLQSLVHNQLSSPRYVNLFQYSWYKSGYLTDRPNKFDNPVEFEMGDSCNTQCEVDGCTNIAIIKCSWCQKSFCLKHFFEEYHFCSNYVP